MGVSKHVKVSIHETANQQKCSSQVGASLGGMEFSHNLWKSVAKIESSQRHAECLCSFYVPRSSWELRKSLASALHFLLFWLSPMKNESISGLLQPKSCSLLPDPLVSYLRKLRLFLFFPSAGEFGKTTRIENNGGFQFDAGTVSSKWPSPTN